MRLARARTTDGVVEGRYVNSAVVTDDREYEIGTEAKLLAPCTPSAIYCLGKNYAKAIEEKGYERPSQPDFFIKPPVSVYPPNREIPYPGFSKKVTYAGELAAIVDERAFRVDPEDVPDVLRGFTIMNDLDALDQRSRTARKAFNAAAPLGPWVETDVDPVGLDMQTVISRDLRQSANTDQMLFDPSEAVSFISQRVTLTPGDVIAFGSPGNPGVVEPGDEVVIEYEGIGSLRNTIVAQD